MEVCKVCGSNIPYGCHNCPVCGYSIDFDPSAKKQENESVECEQEYEELEINSKENSIEKEVTDSDYSESTVDDPISSPPKRKRKRKGLVFAIIAIIICAVVVVGYFDKFQLLENSDSRQFVLYENNVLDLTPIDTSNNGDTAFEIYEVCKDNENHTLYQAFGGVDGSGENIQYYMNDNYSYVCGWVFLNSPYTRVADSSTYFRIYGDGELIYTSPLVQIGMKPTNFCVDISKYDEIGISVYGKNMVRVVDCFFTNREYTEACSLLDEKYAD